MKQNHNAPAKTRKSGGRSARRRAREFALQGVYEWLISNTDPVEIDASALNAEEFDRADAQLYRTLLHGVVDDFVRPGSENAFPD